MMRSGDACSVESDFSVMNRIMLRFRPIAPKPSDAAAAADLDLEKRNISAKNGKRTKRKYVRVRGRQSSKRKTAEEGRSEKSGVEDGGSSPEKGAVTTLQLLPERSESEKSCCYNSNPPGLSETNLLKFDDEVSYNRKADGGTVAVSRSVTKTWITVECVTEIYSMGLRLGVSDREKISNLEVDTCPGFVSDGSNNVVWVNEAYRKLLVVEEGNENGVLVVKEKLPYFAPSFACRVRMIQRTKHGHNWNRIVPCDVWRMDFPGFAWKLDVNTALGLGI